MLRFYVFCSLVSAQTSAPSRRECSPEQKQAIALNRISGESGIRFQLRQLGVGLQTLIQLRKHSDTDAYKRAQSNARLQRQCLAAQIEELRAGVDADLEVGSLEPWMQDQIRTYDKAFLETIGANAKRSTPPPLSKESSVLESKQQKANCMRPNKDSGDDVTNWALNQKRAEDCAEAIKKKVRGAALWMSEQERLSKIVRVDYSTFRASIDQSGRELEANALSQVQKLDRSVDKIMQGLSARLARTIQKADAEQAELQ